MNMFSQIKIAPWLALFAVSFFVLAARSNAVYHCPDLSAQDWYYQAAQYTLEAGLLFPQEDGSFAPSQTLTWGEAAALASAVYTRTRNMDAAKDAVTLLTQAEIALPRDLLQTAHRQGFVYLLDAAVSPQARAQWPNHDFVTTYPYYTPDYVARFYSAGILSGVEYPGDFQPDKPLTRAEAAVILYLTLNPQATQQPEDWPIWMDGVITYEILLWLNFSFPGAIDPLDPPFLELEDGRVVGCHAYFTCLAETVLPLEDPYTFSIHSTPDWQALTAAARHTAILRQTNGAEIPATKTTFLGDLDTQLWYQAFSALREYGPASQVRR